MSGNLLYNVFGIISFKEMQKQLMVLFRVWKLKLKMSHANWLNKKKPGSNVRPHKLN